jgi:hypothetical protein
MGRKRGPGEEFAWAVAAAQGGTDIELPLRASLPTAFPLFAMRPRYTVRHLLKTATVPDRPVQYVHEAAAHTGDAAGISYAATPEAAFAPSLRSAGLCDLRACVPVPKGLLDDPALLASFVDYRVIVRLCTVENESLLHGTPDGTVPGLLRLPGIRRGPLYGPAGRALTRAAAAVEETGGSCDGIVAHPDLYWELVLDGTLGRIEAAGIRVARTRMIARGQALLGDFRAAVTLLDPRISMLALRRGAGQGGTDVIEASTRVGLAVHLAQHFLLLAADPQSGDRRPAARDAA